MAETVFAPLDKVAKLPDGVRENVLVMQHLQEKYQDLFLKFLKERQAVQNKYDMLYEPLYQKRKDIVTGVREPTDDEVKKGEELSKKAEEEHEESKVVEVEEDEDEKEEEHDADVPKEDADAGIPKFWLRALKNEDTVGERIQDKDEPILEHLIDVSCVAFDKSGENNEDDEEATGFTLTFEFKENPYFTNKTLTKTYYTKLDEEDGDELLIKAAGAKIEWAADMNPTVKTKTKKQTKGQKTRVVKVEEPCESFFNFFKPPYAEDKDLTKAIAEDMEEDYIVGCQIRKAVIPRAVAWYTGEAAVIDMDFDGEEDEEDEEDEEGGEQKGDCKQQ